MRLRRILFWAALSTTAVAIGAPLGIAYAMLSTEAPATAPERLVPPLPASPRDGAVTALQPTLAWHGDAQGGTFTLELSADRSFAGRVERHSGIAGNSWSREEPFAPAAQVCWRVRAVGADGQLTGWGPAWCFRPVAGA